MRSRCFLLIARLALTVCFSSLVTGNLILAQVPASA
jgi:hypothetical protein